MTNEEINSTRSAQDRISKSAFRRHVLVSGVPGVGYESLMTALGRTNSVRVSQLPGFRANSFYPSQWLCSLDVVASRMVENSISPTVVCGYAQNIVTVATLPWSKVLWLKTSWSKLKERILAYSKNAGLPTDNEVIVCKTNSLYELGYVTSETLKRVVPLTGGTYSELDADADLDTLVSECKQAIDNVALQFMEPDVFVSAHDVLRDQSYFSAEQDAEHPVDYWKSKYIFSERYV